MLKITPIKLEPLRKPDIDIKRPELPKPLDIKHLDLTPLREQVMAPVSVLKKEVVVEKPEVPERIPIWEKPGRSFMAGIGDTLKTGGFVLDWMGEKAGIKGMGSWAKETGEEMIEKWDVPLEDPKEFEFSDMLNPDWLATRVPRIIPFALSLVPAAIVGAYAGVKIGVPIAAAVGVVKLGAFGKLVLASLGATSLSRPMESAMEAGNAYETALLKGKTKEEAKNIANQAFQENLSLAGMDVAQIIVAFSPLGKGKAFTKTFAKRIMATTGKVAGVGVMEAGEEVVQDVIQRRALGEEITFDPRMKESAALGGIMGIGLGGAGSAFNVLTQRVGKNLPLYQQERIKKAKEGKTGIEAQRAEILELDKIAETPEGKEAIKKTADELLALGKEFDAEYRISAKPKVVKEAIPIAKKATKEPIIVEKGRIPKELEPLAAEARKYKSAKEFEMAIQTLKVRKKISLPSETIIKGYPDYIALREKLVKEGFGKEKELFEDFYAQATKAKEPEMRLLSPVELKKQKLKKEEKIVEGEGFVVKIGGRPTTRAKAIKYIQDEKARFEKEIKEAKTKAAKEAKRKEKQEWLEKIGLVVKDKYPFATEEQKFFFLKEEPAIAKTISHNIDWDKLTPIQQAQIELWTKKKKEGIPLEVLLDAIEKGNLLVPEISTKNLKDKSPIAEHFVKTEDRPKMPTATPENITIPEKKTGGRGLISIIEKFIGDYNWDALEKALPSYPKEIMKLSRDIATEKQKLKAEFKRHEITESKVEQEFRELDRIMTRLLDRLDMALRITKGGNVVPALRESGHNVNLSYAEAEMKDISGLDMWVADPMTQSTTIDKSSYGNFHADVIEPVQLLEVARDQITGIYQHKLRQMAIKHKVLHASLYGESKKERIIVGRLMEVFGERQMGISVDKILESREFDEITNKKNLIEFAKEVRPLMDDIRKIVNIFRIKYGKEPMGYVKDGYLPHMQDANTMFAVLGREKKIKDIMEGGLPDYIVPNQYESPHAKAREYGLDTYELDFFKVYDRYVDGMMKSIFNTIIIHNNKIHSEVLKTKGLPKAALWLETWTAQSYAKVLGRIDKTVLEISPTAYRALNWYRQMLMRLVFPFNLGWSIVTQPSSIILTLGRLGPRHLAEGFNNWFITGKDKKKINQSYTYLVKNQDKGSLLYQDIDVETKFVESGILEKWQDLGTIILRLFERNLTGWSIAAGYSKHKADGLTGRALDYAAQAEGGFTQSMYNFSMKPLLLQSRVLTSTIPFQTFVFQMFNLSKEIAGITGKPRTVNARLAMAFYIIVAAMLWNEYTEKIAGRKIWGWRSAIPFSGAVWSPFDKERSPLSYVATGNELWEAMDKFLNTGNFTSLRKAMIKYGTASLGMAGGLQIGRVVDAAIASYKNGIYSHDNKMIAAIKEPEEKVRAFIFGPWATKRGQEYWNLRESPGLATKAYNLIMGKQPTSYNKMKEKIIEYVGKQKFKNMTEIRNNAELRDMMAEFNVQARDRYHRSIFVKGFEDIIPHDEYFKELKKRTIDYEDLERWFRIK